MINSINEDYDKSVNNKRVTIRIFKQTAGMLYWSVSLTDCGQLVCLDAEQFAS